MGSSRRHVICFYPGDVTGSVLHHAAAAGRLVHLAQLARHAGDEVTVVGLGEDEAIDLPCGLPARAVRLRARGGRLGKARSFFTDGVAVARALVPLIEENGSTHLLVYGSSLKYGLPLHRLARRKGLRIIASVNEWGHAGEQRAPAYWLLRAGVRHAARRFDGIIAISTLMERWFGRHGCGAVVRIPSIFDLSGFPEPVPAGDDGPIILAYAGAVHGGKDAIGHVIRALAQLTEPERARFRFRLYGSTREALAASLGDDAEQVLACTGDLLDFRGFLPTRALRPELATADYTVLLRPREPYAEAGFPTKFAESYLLGVPVLVNLTSDIGLYLESGTQGWVVADHTPEAMAQTLRTVLAQADRRPAQRRAALETGRRAFDLRSHAAAWQQVTGG